ncbi:hypothetical protein TWF694_008843 [Orbilia ellipsospora]|uniref:Uncharacterized protein n=1 Tax=Orbilia ellipsospora TaxID=2528407 RepID=A0AAV9XD38_9PEZI
MTMKFPIPVRLVSFILSLATLTLPSASQAVPTPSVTLAPGVVTSRFHIVERLTVHTSRNTTLVKQKLQQELGNLTQSSMLTAATDSQANYTAAVNRYKGPAGQIWFLNILHGRWFRLWGFDDPAAYVPAEMAQYTFGNPLTLLTIAKYTLNAFLNAPIRMLVYDTADGGTNVMWERPCTQLVLNGIPLSAHSACRALDNTISELVNLIAFG